MTGYIGKATNRQRDVMGEYAQSERESQWGPIQGVTTSEWNGKTVDVQPLYKPRHNGVPVTMPILSEVPLDQPRTANGGLTFPVPIGTKVMLSPQMRAVDDYEEGGEAAPFDARSFHLSTMRASLSGGESLSEEFPNVDLENFHLRFNAAGTFGIKGSPDGKFKIEGAEGNLYDIIATFMELVAADQLQINYGSSTGTGHQLQNRAALIALAAKVRAMAL